MSLPRERLNRWRRSDSTASFVIAGEQRGLAAAYQVAAGIAHVRDGRAVVAQGASHNGGGHGDTAGAGRPPGFVHLKIGALDEPLQQRRMRFAGDGLLKPG
jgi:hypothetical protein